MAENKELLFDMFPGISTEEWRAKVEADQIGRASCRERVYVLV